MQSELDKNKKMQDLIYFQNLVPGAQNSPFIARFKKECLDDDDKDEEYEARQSLLNKFPPVLSFFEDQKKKIL